MDQEKHEQGEVLGNLSANTDMDTDQSLSRRTLLKDGILVASGLVASPFLIKSVPAFATPLLPQQSNANLRETQIKAILASVTIPTFPRKAFPITSFGAVGDGVTDNTAAFRKAIQACAAAGGGSVVVPAGKFLTGPIVLKSNVNLNLVAASSTILFTTNFKAYLPVVPTRWQGIDLMNYSPFIYAYADPKTSSPLTNIGITGLGTIDGQASSSNWWGFKSKENTGFLALEKLASQGTPIAQRVFGDGHFLPPSFIQIYNCKNVLIQGVTLINSPFWNIHPILCTNVTVNSVKLKSVGPNTDGCDPESCNGVVIKNCTFDVGDDCIALKAGRNADSQRVHRPCQNVVISDCTCVAGHGVLTIGSEMTDGVRDVFASNFQMGGAMMESGLRIKTNSQRGGTIQNIHLDAVKGGSISKIGIEITEVYKDKVDLSGVTSIPKVTDIFVSNFSLTSCKTAWQMTGISGSPIGNVKLTACTFTKSSKKPSAIDVSNLLLTNVTVNGVKMT